MAKPDIKLCIDRDRVKSGAVTREACSSLK